MKNKLQKKLFHVKTGVLQPDNFEVESRSENIVANTADEAMKKVRLYKNKDGEEYYLSVSVIAWIDK